MIKNKLLQRAAEEAIVDEYVPKAKSIIDKFLAEKPHKQRSLSKSFPAYKAALFFKAVSEVVKTYKIYSVFGLEYGQISSPTYSYLEVGRDKREEILIEGYRLLRNKNGTKLVAYVYPGRYQMNINIRYGEKNSEDAVQLLKDIETYMKDNNFYKGEKITVCGSFLPIPDLTFDDVKLPEDKKEAIKVGALEFFKKKEIYEKNKIPYKRGLIFTGLPGTGKTLTGKILMAQSDCTFIWATADVCYWPDDIKYIYGMAKELAPCVLFMEDLDNYLARSGAIDVIKTQMDGLESVDGICTILCTNYPEKLPKALLDRPSRFDEVIVFSLPNKQLRYEILMKIGTPMPIKNREQVLETVAEKSDGLTGAHLKEILIYALLLSADAGKEEIEYNDLEKALNKVLKTRELINDKISILDVKSFIKKVYKKEGENSNG